MVNKFVTSKHPVFKHSSIRCIDGVGKSFKNESDNHRMLVNRICFFFAVKNWIQIQTSTLELNQEKVTTSAHHRPHVVQWKSICSSAIRQFVGDHVLLESKKEKVKEQPQSTQQELRCKSFQRRRILKTKHRCWSVLLNETGMRLRRVENNLPNQDLSQDPRY